MGGRARAWCLDKANARTAALIASVRGVSAHLITLSGLAGWGGQVRLETHRYSRYDDMKGLKDDTSYWPRYFIVVVEVECIDGVEQLECYRSS
jgi:hypothetical protein